MSKYEIKIKNVIKEKPKERFKNIYLCIVCSFLSDLLFSIIFAEATPTKYNAESITPIIISIIPPVVPGDIIQAMIKAPKTPHLQFFLQLSALTIPM